MNAVIGGIIRTLLALFAGTVSTTDENIAATFNDFVSGVASGEPDKIGSALLTLAVIAWSIYDKKKRSQKNEKPAT